MMRTIAIYGLALGLCAFALQWLQLQHSIRLLPTEIYVALIALAFTILGIWAGRRLTPTRRARRGDTKGARFQSHSINEMSKNRRNHPKG